jgi:Tol biopolymer transport system component
MRSVVATVVTLALLAIGAGLGTQSGNDLFQQALVKERTDGNVPAAIALYQTIVRKHGSDRALVARALVQMGQCYEKLGRGEAITAYERVVREFGDQTESVATARARLAAIQSPPTVSAALTARQILTGLRCLNESAISPDGRYLGCFSGADPLAVQDLMTGTVVKRPGSIPGLAGDDEGYGMHTAFSRDGRQVAYTWLGARGYELRVLSGWREGPSRPRIVHRFGDEVDYPEFHGNCWTPDGKYLLVNQELMDNTWQIVSISIEDGSRRVLKSLGWRSANNLSISPDGTYVAYATEAGDGTRPGRPRDIFVLAADGSRETVLEHRADDVGPVWSPDGSELLFVSDRSGKDWSLYAVPIDAGRVIGPVRLVKEDIGNASVLGMSPSGVLTYLLNHETRSNVYVAELGANAQVTRAAVPVTDRFIHSNGSPAWSRDGKYLAYYSKRVFGEPTGLVIRAALTGEERYVSLTQPSPRSRLANEGGAGLEWFPDGGSLLVVRYEQRAAGSDDRRHAFYRVDAGDGGARLLFKSDIGNGFQGLNDPEVSPDGQSIFYVTPIIAGDGTPPRKLVRFDLAVQRETVLTRGVLSSLALSPDGAQVAYAVMSPQSSRWGIELMPAAGGEARALDLGAPRPDPIRGLAWTPDQQSLLFVRAGKLWRVAGNGGEPLDTGLSKTLTPHVHADGRRIAFEAVDAPARTEVWVLENLLPKPRASR